ncbi:hypothetical protein ACWEFJ_28360 [Actinosynnema sp. NPDC004786]
MLIEHPHFVHPDDVDAAGTLRGPLADPEAAAHPDYVAEARAWLEHYLIGEYHRLVDEDNRDRRERYAELRAQGVPDAAARAQLPPRWLDRGEPVVRELDEPYTTADGVTWQLPYRHVDGVVYEVGWIGTLEVHPNPAVTLESP